MYKTLIAAFGNIRESAKRSRYICSAENSGTEKKSKQDMAGVHYYLSKGVFPGDGGVSVVEFIKMGIVYMI